ncbi:unnamed protein product [Allacma fusca]|uniref:Uncharacterized protein n=1 Tax=Allacma fusca TaxID=39272 RepID=A0A8J2KFB4_9HEXA|nr:unnamed protein product [Allacma fusca]
MDAHILSSECTRIWGHIEENDDDSWRNVNVSPLRLFSAEQTVESEVLSQPLGKDADADIDSNFQKVIVGPINSTSHKNQLKIIVLSYLIQKSNPGKREVDRENFIAPKKAQLERPPDSEDYHPLSSGSSEESVKDPESDNPSKNEDISSDAGHRSNSQLKKQERTDRPQIFQKWKLAHRMRQLDATDFIFDDKFPFEVYNRIGTAEHVD